MELQQLIYFQMVARLENVSEASKQLHVSQPAVSMSIKKLEAELGIPLFDRNKNNLKLNRFGKTFLMRIDSAIDQIQCAKEEIEGMYSTEQNRLIVMSGPHEMEPPIIDELFRRVPNVVIENRNVDSRMAISLLIDETVDLCVINSELSDPQISSINLLNQRFGVVLNEKHQLADRKKISVKELAKERFSLYRDGSGPRRVLDKIFFDVGFSPIIIFEASSTQPMFEPVKLGRCITLSTEFVFDKYASAGIVWIPLDEDKYCVNRNIAYKKGKSQNRAVREYVRIILEKYNISLNSIEDANIV